MVVAATTGEEVGLLGTRWYQHPALPLAAMQANLEIEMIGRPDSLAGGAGRVWLTGFERSTMGQSFVAAGLAVAPDKRPDQQFFMRSDNIAFARMGIPAHTLSSFNLHTDYHQLTDEITGVDFAHMAGVINIGVKAVELLANGRAPHWNDAAVQASEPGDIKGDIDSRSYSRFPTLCVETLAISGARRRCATGAVAAPIYLSTTFERAADGSLPHGYLYARRDPNRTSLGACSRAEAALPRRASHRRGRTWPSFSRSRRSVILLHRLRHAQIDRSDLRRWGLTSERGHARAARRGGASAERASSGSVASNPLLAVADIERIAAIAHEAGARCAVDNTWATPVAQQPLALGADLVMHSTTKYLGGHGDVTGGALVAREDDEFFQRVRTVQTAGGAVAAPFDCWLVVRGIKTLPYRIRAHTANATAVAQFLASHPNVEAVHYPGLPSHPGHTIAKRQMSAFGGMVSVQVRGGGKRRCV